MYILIKVDEDFSTTELDLTPGLNDWVQVTPDMSVQDGIDLIEE